MQARRPISPIQWQPRPGLLQEGAWGSLPGLAPGLAAGHSSRVARGIWPTPAAVAAARGRSAALGGPSQESLGLSCREIGRPCFARWLGHGPVAWARPRPGHGAKGPWAPTDGPGRAGRAGVLAVGWGPAARQAKATKPGQWACAMPNGHGPAPGRGLYTRGPRDVTGAGGEEAARRRRRRCWRLPLGRSIQPPGAFIIMGPSMGPERGVSWGPGRAPAINEVPLAPPNCGGILRDWAV